METTSLLDDLINDLGDIGLIRDVCFDGVELAWVLLRDGFELVACVADVDGVDCSCVVRETAVCNSEADAAIC